MKYCLLAGADRDYWGFEEEKLGIFDSIDECLDYLRGYREPYYSSIVDRFTIINGDFKVCCEGSITLIINDDDHTSFIGDLEIKYKD